MSRTRSLTWTILALTTVPVFSGCFDQGEASAELDELRAYVRVEPVTRGELMHTLEITGTVQAAHQVDLVTDLPGKLESVPVRVGQQVSRGQLLVQLDTDVAALQLEQADAAVKLAELGFVSATRDFSRMVVLHDKGSLADQPFEQAQAGMEMAELQLQQAQAMRGLAREQVQGGRLLAPFDGVVTYIAGEEGEYFNPMTVSPMAGLPGLVGLVDPSGIKLDLQVADADVGRLQEGMQARVFVDALGDRIPEGGVVGRVESVGLAADATSRTFPVRVGAENPDRAVLAGTHARVRLVLESQADVLHVPEEAVRGGEGASYVMVLDGERARKVEVATGLRGDAGVEIIDGLQGGELVVVEGNFGLADGALVEVSS